MSALLPEEKSAKVMRIHNTLDLVELLVSKAYGLEAKKRDDLTVIDGPAEMEFDLSGDLLPF